jgi:hypothetical protein
MSLPPGASASPGAGLFTGLLCGTNTFPESDPTDTLLGPAMQGQPDGTEGTAESAGITADGPDGGGYDFADLPSPRGGEGLPPAHWQQQHHLGSWLTYRPDQSFNGVFGVEAPGEPTLLQALRAKGIGVAALGRQAVAALLNAASAAVGYRYTVDQVIGLVQEAYYSGAFQATARLLAGRNYEGMAGHPRTGTVTGFIRGAVPQPLGGVVVGLTTTDGHGRPVIRYATTDSNGFYKFAGLQPGTYTLTVFPHGTDSGSEPVSLGVVSLAAANVRRDHDFSERPALAGG